MDDMVFQNNNKNAIYVLNTSYNTYGEFGRPNTFGYPQTNSYEIYNNSKNCSISRSLHKLKSLRYHSNEIMAGGPSSATECNSSSMTSCSPAAAALQKLFNCSSSTTHSCRSINYRNTMLNNNCHNSNSHINPYLSHHHGTSNYTQNRHFCQKETGTHYHPVHHPQLEYHNLMQSQMSLSFRNNNNTSDGCSGSGGGNPSSVLPCVGGVIGGKKKHFNSSNSVKSALIAKKTKFWKYLVEEEKWRKHSDENLPTTNNCELDQDRKRFIGKSSPSKSNTNNIHNAIGAEPDGRITQDISNHSIKSNSGGCISNSLNYINWSGKNDGNKTNSSVNQKSSTELYKEAAQLLGLSCTLCDNCRCLDCQSRYFECDDSDSYSEISFMDECFEGLPTEIDRNLHHRASPSLNLNQQHLSQNETSSKDQQPARAYFKNNVLDHCESLNDLTLEENCIENED